VSLMLPRAWRGIGPYARYWQGLEVEIDQAHPLAGYSLKAYWAGLSNGTSVLANLLGNDSTLGGTVGGGAPAWGTCAAGPAWKLNGTSDYFNLPAALSMKGLTRATIFASYIPYAIPTNYVDVIGELNEVAGTDRFSLQHVTTSGNLRIVYRDASSAFATAGTAITWGNVYTAVATVNSDTDALLLYLNGGKVDQELTAKGPMSGTTTYGMYIGALNVATPNLNAHILAAGIYWDELPPDLASWLSSEPFAPVVAKGRRIWSPGIPSASTLTDNLALTDSFFYQLVFLLHDTLSLQDSVKGAARITTVDLLSLLDSHSAKVIQTKQSLTDTIAIRDSLRAAVQKAISDTLSLTDAVKLSSVVFTLADTVGLSDNLLARITIQLALLDTVVLTDAWHVNYRIKLADALTLADAWVKTASILTALADQISLSDSFANTFRVQLLLSDTVSLTDALGWKIQKVLSLADTVLLVGQLQIGTDKYFAWAFNTRTGGAYKFSNFPFNSFAHINGKNLMCAPDGIYELGGGDDAGAAIQGMFKTGRLNLADPQNGFPEGLLKEMLAAYLLFEADGETLLKVTISRREGEVFEHWYSLHETAQMSKRQLPISNSLRSVLWQFEITKLDGKPAAFREIETIPLFLTRRV
jgi:hypothetical protein